MNAKWVASLVSGAVLLGAVSLPLVVSGGPIGPGIAGGVAMAAYDRAATSMAAASPPCAIPVWLLAAVGDVESDHGTSGGSSAGADGTVAPPIVGAKVPGLADSDEGRWDGSATEDRAVGPMQLLPSTWAQFGRDGNGDGRSDPQNLYDAALAAAAYLCAHGAPMATDADWRTGLFAYNHSPSYVDHVLKVGERYRSQAAGPRLQEVPGIGLTNAAWADRVTAMLDAARADGLELTGSSYRDRASQVLLRRAHCGRSDYAIYDMPADACDPPTARPGTSLHEQGLAIDFDNCGLRSTACFQWLQTNAARFGLFNLPTEPWHWSVTGG